ncbi:MAG: hypothetical protein OXL37_12545 [Chloroflexota bacterium]|nr:hypothetical protein [Chloroflexota bacterium]MDE2959325.1 hypothetical protein [Chloroflexota bacterium]
MVVPRSHGYYQGRSHHFLTLVNDFLERGELEIACEVLWGAAAHAIKSVAQRKGWEHGSHGLLLITINRLIEETGAPQYLHGQYRMASDFHVGFYGDRLFGPEHLRMGRALIAEFVQALEGLS